MQSPLCVYSNAKQGDTKLIIPISALFKQLVPNFQFCIHQRF